eukprot:s433_g18.t3
MPYKSFTWDPQRDNAPPSPPVIRFVLGFVGSKFLNHLGLNRFLGQGRPVAHVDLQMRIKYVWLFYSATTEKNIADSRGVITIAQHGSRWLGRKVWRCQNYGRAAALQAGS